MSDLVKLYNPASAASLTPEQIEGLQKLTSAEIKELADAYPNLTMNRAYLLIVDNRKPVEKQLPNLSSFQNLWNLREKNGQRNYVAYNFMGNYKSVTNIPAKAKRSEVLDLSDTELMSLPGFKKSGAGGFKELPIVTEANKNDLKVSEPETVKVGIPETVKIIKLRKIAKAKKL